MCGIGGYMTADGSAPPAGVIDALIRSLGHRGPDGQGRYLAGGIALAHTRLAIIDLEGGDQPIHEPGGAVLVANGEIYNYIELYKELKNVAFATHSDCEPPLHLYRRHGVDYANYLRGMYAIALYDPAEERLVLSRDPFGIKPLYYAEIERGLVFGSEPRALVATGLISPRVRPPAAAELMQLQFNTGRETIFEGIQRVLPGETLVAVRGRIVERHRRNALPAASVEEKTEEDALNELNRVLMDSVSVHQRSDVPYGLFLSGGIDSSVLIACMARLNDQPVRAFTAGFPGTAARDEREHARAVARRVGAEHIEVEVDENDLWNSLPAIARAMDDPAADYAVVPTYKLASEAAKELKVVLCGEGGDELFAGYGRYRSYMRPLWLGGRTLRARGFLDGLGVLREENPSWRDGILAADSRVVDDGASRLQRAQAIDCSDWLPNDLLIKVDRCLMAHSLEGRTPLLDPQVAAVAYRLPDKLKVSRGQGKYLLRKWLEKHLPEAEPFSAKRGFTVPVGEWIAPKARRLGEFIAAQEGVAAVCRPDAVRALYARLDGHGRPAKRAGAAAWMLLFYALWHQVNVLGASAEGDVFETLANGI